MHVTCSDVSMPVRKYTHNHRNKLMYAILYGSYTILLDSRLSIEIGHLQYVILFAVYHMKMENTVINKHFNALSIITAFAFII